MTLAARIRSARKAEGITQEELARRAGVGLNLVNRIERGVITDPHYSTLTAFAGALDTTIGALTGEQAADPKAAAPSPSGREERQDIKGPDPDIWGPDADRPDPEQLQWPESQGKRIDVHATPHGVTVEEMPFLDMVRAHLKDAKARKISPERALQEIESDIEKIERRTA